MSFILELFGPDRTLAAITRHDAAELRKLVEALPADRNTRPESRDLTLQEAIVVPCLETISAKTVIRRFWDWAERHGHAPDKLFDGMKVKKANDGDEGRKAYTPAQTAKMHATFTGNAPGIVRKVDFEWGALLGLYTAARLREIA